MPSNIWVGVGLMKPAKVTFPLAPVYERAGIELVQAAARELHPEGDSDAPSPYVIAESADGTRSKLRYDFLIRVWLLQDDSEVAGNGRFWRDGRRA